MSRARRRRSLYAPEGLDAVLERAGEDRFAWRRPPVADRVWTAAMGPRIAERSRPIALERGVLTVRVATSVWASELSLLAPSLIARLRDEGLRVNELRFRVGPIDPPARPPERRTSRAIPAPARLPRELAAAIARVADDGLKEAIALAARANLAWQEHTSPPERDADEDGRAAVAPRSEPSRPRR